MSEIGLAVAMLPANTATFELGFRVRGQEQKGGGGGRVRV